MRDYRGEKLFVKNEDKTHLAKQRMQCFIAYHRKAFTEERITFHGLRHTYAHEKYEEYISIGKNEKEARKMVSELLGHHRDVVTRIYLYEDGDFLCLLFLTGTKFLIKFLICVVDLVYINLDLRK